jgi:pSer/pThr/pTyr-binding forkhead associated (FHA) protein
MQVVLVMFRADGERKSFSITRDVTVIGRREDCDFRIPLGDISRKHCRLIKEETALKIEDLGSSNGTYINGQRIHDTELSPGDTIQIGPVVFVVQLEGSPADDDLKPFRPSEAKKKASKPRPQPAEEPVAEEEEAVMLDDDEPATTASSNGEAEGDFDPMSVLEGNVDSDIMPALPDSALNEDVMVDLSDSERREA